MNHKNIGRCCLTIVVFFNCIFSISSLAKNDDLGKLSSEDAFLKFDNAYKLFLQEDFVETIPVFYEIIENAGPNFEKYEWATLFLGISLENLGYSIAAIDYYKTLLAESANSNIIDYLFIHLEKNWQDKPFDYTLFIDDVLNARNFDIATTNEAAIVHFIQGVHDWRSGYQQWAEDHFSKIPPASPYFQKVKLHKAIDFLYRNDVDQSISLLQEITDSKDTTGELGDQARWILARLLYEKGEYEDALHHYKNIETPVIEQASVLLEQAWGHFYIHEPKKAMGLLYAYEAPDLKRFFTPEFFLLKAFIYKNICDYGEAIAVVDQFENRYQPSLNAIKQRQQPVDGSMPELLYQIMNDDSINEHWKIVQQIEQESADLEAINHDPLTRALKNVYQRELEKHRVILKRAVNDEFLNLANGLLQYEEQLDLLRYEVGIDQFQRISDIGYMAKARNNIGQEPNFKERAVYNFRGEYWNDELDSYEVLLEDHCEKTNGWDAFIE